MTVYPDQADPKLKHSCMTYRVCVQLPIYVDGIDAIINTQMLKTPHDLLLHLMDLGNRRKLYIGILNKEGGDIISECYTEIFKEKFLPYINEVPFEMVKASLKDTYIGGKIPQH